MQRIAVALDRLPLRGMVVSVKFGPGSRIRTVIVDLQLESTEGG
jgi:hypothetical protein